MSFLERLIDEAISGKYLYVFIYPALCYFSWFVIILALIRPIALKKWAIALYAVVILATCLLNWHSFSAIENSIHFNAPRFAQIWAQEVSPLDNPPDLYPDVKLNTPEINALIQESDKRMFNSYVKPRIKARLSEKEACLRANPDKREEVIEQLTQIIQDNKPSAAQLFLLYGTYYTLFFMGELLLAFIAGCGLQFLWRKAFIPKASQTPS